MKFTQKTAPISIIKKRPIITTIKDFRPGKNNDVNYKIEKSK
mgnify:CR=1 FL=1